MFKKNSEYDISQIKERMLNMSILLFTILFIPSIFFMIFRIMEFGFKLFYLLELIGGIFIILIFFLRKKLSITFRTIAIIVISTLAVTTELFTVGILSTTLLIYSSLVLIIALYLGQKASYLSLILFSIIILIVALLSHFKLIFFEIDAVSYIYSIPAWLDHLVTFLLAVGVITLSYNTLYRSLVKVIDNQKKMNDKLEEAILNSEEGKKLKSAFLSTISYEIRTPMNGILGFVDILKKKKLTEEKTKHFLDIIQSSCNQLLKVVNDIIDYSMIESGQIELFRQELNLKDLLRSLFAYYQPIANRKNLILDYVKNEDDHNPIIFSDNLKLYQILSNLISNAVKFTNFGKVEFGYAIKDNFIEFFVKDSGIGMKKELKNIAFEKFKKLRIDENQQDYGTGLGLTISKAFVEIMGGKIWFESVENEGSIFYFTVPYQASVSIAQTDVKTSYTMDVNWNQKSILLLEESTSNEQQIRGILDITNAHIIQTDSGEEIIKICQQTPEIDIVILDVATKDITGFDTTRAVKKIRPNLPVFILSANTLQGDREKAINAGSDQFLKKPVNANLLLKLIDFMLNSPEQLQDKT